MERSLSSSLTSAQPWWCPNTSSSAPHTCQAWVFPAPFRDLLAADNEISTRHASGRGSRSSWLVLTRVHRKARGRRSSDALVGKGGKGWGVRSGTPKGRRQCTRRRTSRCREPVCWAALNRGTQRRPVPGAAPGPSLSQPAGSVAAAPLLEQPLGLHRVCTILGAGGPGRLCPRPDTRSQTSSQRRENLAPTFSGPSAAVSESAAHVWPRRGLRPAVWPQGGSLLLQTCPALGGRSEALSESCFLNISSWTVSFLLYWPLWPPSGRGQGAGRGAGGPCQQCGGPAGHRAPSAPPPAVP